MDGCERAARSNIIARTETRLGGTGAYQVNVRHKVAVKGRRDAKGPNAISQRPPDVDVEELAHGRAPTARAGVGGLGGQQRPVGEAGQHQHEHEDAEDAQGVLEAHSAQQARQHEGQRDGEDAAAGRHDAVHQAQPLLEVVAQDDQAGLVCEGAAAGEDDAVGEVEKAQGPGGKQAGESLLTCSERHCT